MNASTVMPFADPRFGVSGAEIFRAAAEFARRGDVGLATITAREGASARPVGAQLAVAADGAFAGSMSSGCIDGSLAAIVLDAMARRQGRRVRIGAGSPIIDLRLPCGGAMEILVTASLERATIERVNLEIAARRPAAIALTEASVKIGAAAAHAVHAMTIEPPLRLLLAGRGANLAAMTRAARAVRFDVAAWSPDPDDARSLAASGCLTERDAPALMAMLDARAALVLMFHEHEREIEILKAALRKPAFYTGAMGARITHERRIEALRAEGVSEQDLARITGPIGLIPSLRDPDALAVSVLAEIMQAAKSQGLI